MKHPRLLIALALTVLAAAWGRGCAAHDEPAATTVVLYASADEHIVRKVVEAFQEQSDPPIKVLLVGDTEVKKTTGLVDRLRAEADKPQADVFWSSEVFMTIGLADDGLLEAYESPATADWPKEHRDEQHRWHGFAARARVIAYAPKRVGVGGANDPHDPLPKTWMDLTSARFRDRIVMADPRFGTTGGHLGAMKAYWDREVMPGYFEAYMEGLAANRVRMLPGGNAGVVAAIISGEADLGMTDTDDVWAAQAQGHDIKCIYPLHDAAGGPGSGTLLIPNTVALMKNAPHPDEARQLIDFLLSEQVERMLAESVSHNIPLRWGAGGGIVDEGWEYALPAPGALRIDYEAAAKQRADAIKIAMRVLADGAPARERAPAATQPDPPDKPAPAPNAR